MAGLCQVYYFLREQRHTRKLKIYLIKLFKHVCYLFSLLIKISGLKYNYFPLKKRKVGKYAHCKILIIVLPIIFVVSRVVKSVMYIIEKKKVNCLLHTRINLTTQIIV